MKYVTPRAAAEYFKVGLHTLRRWEKKGIIKAVRTPSGAQRRYDLDSWNAESRTKQVVLYARVRSAAQRGDLNRQVARLVELYPEARVVAEIGNSLDFNRKQFLALLEQVAQGAVGTIVVAHQDRLCRFGFELVKWYCERHGCQIVVLGEKDLSPERELVENVLSILHRFSSRLHGLRKYKAAIKEDKDLPGPRAG
ncbi:MAG: IS607 family transposase [Gloeomargarita sp. SKYG98]|nr:IS607 family transposase [Gloeomargarita sp. SKYG98]